MPTLSQISAPRRAESLIGNTYTLSSPYRSDGLPFVPDLGTFIATGYPEGMVSTSDRAPNIYTEGATALRAIIDRRVALETLDEIIPSNINILGGGPAVLRADDYRITKDFLPINVLERFTGININSDPFTKRDALLRGSSATDDKYFKFTGRFQKFQLERQASNNYYSTRSGIKLDGSIYNLDDLSINYTNKRLRGLSDYKSSYVYLRQDLEAVRASVDAISRVVKKGDAGIEKVLAEGFSMDTLRIDGEFGENYLYGIRRGPCGSNSPFYNINNTYDLNHALDDAERDPEKTIVWGATTQFAIENKFKAKRGLLNFTSQMTGGGSGIAPNPAADMTRKCFNRNGDIVYKGGPCRSWTFLDSYGKTADTLVRVSGNGNPDSVAKDYVHPKIHPVRDPNTGKPDTTNMMFSFENLAYTKQDLIEYSIPECEWGPRFGRILWFPPYIESYREDITANWNGDKFLGRSEPLYTYSNTVRSFTLTFHLIMDYPFWMDRISDPKEFARLFHCGDPDESDDLLIPPDFGITTQTPGFTPEPIELPPVEVPDLIDDVEVEGLRDIKFYFDNDIYRINQYYEYWEDPTGGDLTNLFGLNSDFLGLDPSSSIPPVDSEIDSEGKPLNAYKRLYTEDTADLGPFSDFYDVRFVGNASKLFIGAQTGPAIYNRYLSYRRAFSLAKEFSNRYGIPESSMKLDTKQTARSFLNANSSAIQTGRFSSLADFDPNRMFPFAVGAYAGENDYNIPDFGKIIFTQVKSDGSEGLTIEVYAEGSSNSLVATDDTDFDNRQSKADRNVTISALLDRAKVKAKEEEIRARLEAERQRRQDELNASLVPIPPSAQLGTTADDETNCFGRFSTSDPRIQKGLRSIEGFTSELYGFRKYRRFQAGFHSQTPEDFHRRLAFLSQLMYTGRAFGDTARNASFGRSPITVMRVGDFYHTKMVIDTMSYDFNDAMWDLNPEGMGVQPMKATVTLAGKLLGGQSLKGPIERLQNAVSFNHHANSTFYRTGMYENAVKAQNVQTAIDQRRRDEINSRTQQVN